MADVNVKIPTLESEHWQWHAVIEVKGLKNQHWTWRSDDNKLLRIAIYRLHFNGSAGARISLCYLACCIDQGSVGQTGVHPEEGAEDCIPWPVLSWASTSLCQSTLQQRREDIWRECHRHSESHKPAELSPAWTQGQGHAYSPWSESHFPRPITKHVWYRDSFILFALAHQQY